MAVFRFDWNLKSHKLLIPNLSEILESIDPQWTLRLIAKDPTMFCLFSLSKKYTVESVLVATAELLGNEYSLVIRYIDSKKSEFKKEAIEYLEGFALANPEARVTTLGYQTSMGNLKYFTKTLGFTLAGITLIKPLSLERREEDT